jgi:formiminoglutamase
MTVVSRYCDPPPDWRAAAAPGRMAHEIRTQSPQGCRVALLGLPDEMGVRLNGGRPGAAQGPDAFRKALARYGTARPERGSWPPIFDAGDVRPTLDLDETHRRVTAVTSELLQRELLPVAIGGGHDLTFPFVRALAEREARPLSGIYLDAHLDVRDEPGSGMAFRRLVEACGVQGLDVRGMDPYSNRRDHLAWFRAHGGKTGGFGPDDPWPSGPLFMSVDLDVIDQAFAPGVSAQNPAGWSPTRVEAWVQAAGRCSRIGAFDLMELSPPWDEGGRTARLAARLFCSFLHGVSERPPGSEEVEHGE